jgi:hypothetical protein
MPSKSSRSVPFSQSSALGAPNSAAATPALRRPRRWPLAFLGLALAAVVVSRAQGSNRRVVFLGLEKGVLLEHLLDFLLQLQRRQLQQADRLLQLRRQRQVLRQAT